MILTFLSVLILEATFTLAASIQPTVSNGPVINHDFPDPGIMRDSNGTWYAYSTASILGLAPMSKSLDFVTWSSPVSVLGDIPWVDDHKSVWAPDVREITAGHYVMYFTGHLLGGSPNDRCIGIATADSPDGPFTANPNPHICDDALGGGAIDPSSFRAPNGTLFLLWKVGGDSMNEPARIMMQQVGENGFDLLGSPMKLINSDPIDAGVVGAPSMIFWDGWFYLFFNSNSFNTLISYAVSRDLAGPFTKVPAPDAPFLTSGMLGVAQPGGATVINASDQSVNMAFHSSINGRDLAGGRAMWTISNICLKNGTARVTC